MEYPQYSINEIRLYGCIQDRRGKFGIYINIPDIHISFVRNISSNKFVQYCDCIKCDILRMILIFYRVPVQQNWYNVFYPIMFLSSLICLHPFNARFCEQIRDFLSWYVYFYPWFIVCLALHRAIMLFMALLMYPLGL